MPTPPHDPDVGVPLLLQSLVLPFVAGAIGSAATIPNLSGWFDALEMPAFSPPKAVLWTGLDEALPADGGGALPDDDE